RSWLIVAPFRRWMSSWMFLEAACGGFGSCDGAQAARAQREDSPTFRGPRAAVSRVRETLRIYRFGDTRRARRRSARLRSYKKKKPPCGGFFFCNLAETVGLLSEALHLTHTGLRL